MLFPPFFKIPLENKLNFPDGFIESGNVFEVQILKYKDPTIQQEKIDKFINFVKQDKLNLFSEMIKIHKRLGLDDVDDIYTGYTDKIDELPRGTITSILNATEQFVFKGRAESMAFWKAIYDEYISDVASILHFRLLGTYWTDLAIEGSSQYRYYREFFVKGAFEIDAPQYDNVLNNIVDKLDLKRYNNRDESFANIGKKVGSRNLKNPKERPYIDLRYYPDDLFIQPMKMIIVKQLINFYMYLMNSYRVGSIFTFYMKAIKGFNFYYSVSKNENKPDNLPAEEGNLKAIYDKWFNRTNPNLKYPDYYGINYMNTPIVVKEFRTQKKQNDWNKLP